MPRTAVAVRVRRRVVMGNFIFVYWDAIGIWVNVVWASDDQFEDFCGLDRKDEDVELGERKRLI